MRWTDRPAAPAPRTVAEWLDGLRGTPMAPAGAALAGRVAAHGAGSPPLVVLWPEALHAAWQHLAGCPFERGGLLLGEPLHASADDRVPAVVSVRVAVPGSGATATSVSLRLDTGVWDAARQALQPRECIVGWFHSHPDLGAFFSGTDRRTQAGFFHHAFSLGWVVDPVRREQAWFVGPHAQPLPPASLLVAGGDA